MNNTPFKAPLGASIGWFVRLSGGLSVCLIQKLAKESQNLSYLSKGVIGELLHIYTLLRPIHASVAETNSLHKLS